MPGQRGGSFGAVAEAYDLHRPGYPRGLFEQLWRALIATADGIRLQGGIRVFAAPSLA
jgi:hypothetical protein